jgi:ABC-type polysaccharide/polyol phosphate export permease
MKRLNLALEDIKKAIAQYRVWLHLGLLEVKQRYQRSILGPWWVTISMFIFILAMGKIFSRLFVQDLSEYLPFFTTGFLLWTFISSSINESTEIFRVNAGFIKQIKLPYNLYPLKFFARNVVFLLHNAIVYFFVIWFFKIHPGWNGLLVIPGMMLLIINMYWICLLVALASTRFRDMVPIINSCTQILFFVTPISWMPKLFGQDSIVLKLNPLVYFLDVTRQPLLGIAPSSTVWMINISIAIVGIVISLIVFSFTRSRIPFWLD